MLPRWSGRQVPWAIISPEAVNRAVEKSMASFRTNDRAVLTTVTAISSAIDSRAFLTSSTVILSEGGFAPLPNLPPGVAPAEPALEVIST
jgi:hypothetical protein